MRKLGSIAASLALASIGGLSDVSAQSFSASGIIGGVGGLLQGAMQADQQRQQLEQVERIEQLRLQQLQYQNNMRRTLPPGAYAAPAPVQPPINQQQVSVPAQPNVANPQLYKVDGRRLGDLLRPQILKAFECNASEQFDQFTRCKRSSLVQKIPVYESLLLSTRSELAYDNKFYQSARFEPGAVEGQIEKLSGDYRGIARQFRMATESDGSGAVIAVWGALTLTPLDGTALGDLTAGKPVKAGMLIDFLNNPGESSKRGLPVYRFGGSAGYYWEARWDRSGLGTLRFGMANPALFERPAAAPGIRPTRTAL